jgi:hypothetical protein
MFSLSFCTSKMWSARFDSVRVEIPVTGQVTREPTIGNPLSEGGLSCSLLDQQADPATGTDSVPLSPRIIEGQVVN